MPDIKPHPLIISGAPRSGTTLLYNLFDGHPEVSWLETEGYLFEHLFDLDLENTGLFLSALPKDHDQLIAGLRDKQIMPPLNEPYSRSRRMGVVAEYSLHARWAEDEFRRALAMERPPSIEGLWYWLARAYLAGARQSVRTFACMKSPDFAKSAIAATTLIPHAKAVVIIRDPLFALDSLKRAREMRGEKLVSWPLFAQLVRMFQRMHSLLSNAKPEKVTWVRYETLVVEPEVTMRGLADWIGIDFETCLVHPTMRGEKWPGHSSFTVMSGIEDTAVTRPIKTLTPDEQQMIRVELVNFRRYFGYE